MPTHDTQSSHRIVLPLVATAYLFVLAASASLTSAVFATSLSAQPQAKGSVAAPRVDGRIFRADSFWVQKWVRGGMAEEDLFVEPRKLVATDDAVAVLDLGTREVHLLSTVDGTTKRVMKATGSGPGEFTQPSNLVRDRSLFGVFDQGNGRISMFTTSGKLVWDAPLSDAHALEGACVLPGARLLVKVSGRRDALRVTDSSGKGRGLFSLPDAAKDTIERFGASASVAGPSRTGQCALVPLFGAQWHTITAKGQRTPHRYIEAGAEAAIAVDVKPVDKRDPKTPFVVTQKPNADPIARSAHMIGDTLVVAAGATKRNPLRLLDYYLMSTGSYLYSRKLPEVFTTLTIGADGTFYAGAIAPEVSWVVALSPSRTPPIVEPKTGKPKQ